MSNLLKLAIFPLALASISLPVSASCGNQPFIGEICTFPYNFCPVGFAETSGQLMAIAGNETLFQLIGTTYGGDGFSTFAIPDLRGHNIIGVGLGTGLTPVALGEQGGNESVKLTAANLPTHTHNAITTVASTLKGTNAEGSSPVPLANLLAKSGTVKTYGTGIANVTLDSSSVLSKATTKIGLRGGSQPFGNRKPYLGMTTCIALFGIFPAHN